MTWKYWAALGILWMASLAAGADSASDEKIRQVAASKAWRMLLHYQPNWYGKPRSLIDGAGFFLAPDGKTNPESELRASLAALNTSRTHGKLNQPVNCAFPERFRFLSEQFNLPLKRESCPQWEQFLEQFHEPRALNLVFSSAYPNNPASMFGHTFLRVSSARGTDLLDTGINYAAWVAPEDANVEFVWRGTTGGYIGSWSTQPYYVKVNEYSNFESRDLWEYELNLSPDEVRRFLAHIWEMETNSHSDYYFFDENCSYQILMAITAIRPDWDILRHRIYVIPGETIKNLTSTPGVVRSIKFRPSAHNRLYQRYNALTAKERGEFFAVISGDKPVEESQSRVVLDAVASYFDYQRNEAKAKYQADYEQRRERLLSHRAKLGPTTAEEERRLAPLSAKTQPELGHDPYALSVGLGLRERESAGGVLTRIKLKSAYHDLLNREDGFTRFSHIDFPWLTLSHDELKKEITLEEIGGLAITSLYPMTRIDWRPSWRANLGVTTVRDYGCEDCRHVNFDAAAGGALSLIGYRLIGYVMGGGRAEAYRLLHHGYRLGPLTVVGLLATIGERYRLNVQGECYWPEGPVPIAQRITKLELTHAYSLSRNLELRQANVLLDPAARSEWRWWESRLDLTWFFR